MLTKSVWVALAGLVVVLLGAIAWMVVSERERHSMVGDVPEGPGVPLNVSGPGGVGWWGMVFGIVTFGVMLTSLLFSYYYLAFHNESWPPLLGTAPYPPPWLLPLVALALVVVSIVPMRLSVRSSSRNAEHPSSLAMVVAACLAVAAVALNIVSWTGLDFDWRTDAYGSAFFALAVFQTFMAVIAVLGVVALLLASWRYFLLARRHYLVANFAVFWYFMVATFVVVYVVLHLVPLVRS
jgi:cytochrome c oxidase subunit 3